MTFTPSNSTFDKLPPCLCADSGSLPQGAKRPEDVCSAEFFIFIDIFPAKTYNNIRDGKPSSGEFLPDSGKLYIQESSCQIVENFINQEIPCQTVGNFKIEG